MPNRDTGGIFGVGALGELQNSYANMQRQTEGGDQEPSSCEKFLKNSGLLQQLLPLRGMTPLPL